MYFCAVTRGFLKPERYVVECPDLPTAIRLRIQDFKTQGVFYGQIRGGIYLKPPMPLYANLKEIMYSYFGLNTIPGRIELVSREQLDATLEQLMDREEIMLQKTSWHMGWKVIFTLRRQRLSHLPEGETWQSALEEPSNPKIAVLYKFHLGNGVKS